MENLDFVATTNGLEVSFRVLSEVPAKAIFDWDFGDDKGSAYDVKQPTYTYEKSGFYTVALNITDSDGLNLSATKHIIVNTEAVTTLTDSIYNLINYFIPSEISDGMTMKEKEMYITKWQLYIQPLVNHCIPLDKYNDELMYEALENQLIMELAAWDYLNVKLLNLLTSTGEYLSQLTSTKEQEGDGSSKPELTRGDRIKQITTGPTEVQYYDMLSDSTSSLWKTFSQALQPGGVIDELKQRLCMLATRLEIYLPFCNPVNKLVVPRVVDRRRPGILDGPNPSVPVKRNGRTLIKKR